MCSRKSLQESSDFKEVLKLYFVIAQVERLMTQSFIKKLQWVFKHLVALSKFKVRLRGYDFTHKYRALSLASGASGMAQ